MANQWGKEVLQLIYEANCLSLNGVTSEDGHLSLVHRWSFVNSIQFLAWYSLRASLRCFPIVLDRRLSSVSNCQHYKYLDK